MLNRSAILKAAWAVYRTARPAIFAAGDTSTRRVFLRSFFAKMLRRAWADAKQADATARRFADADKAARLFVDSQHAARVALAAAMTAAQLSARLSAVRDELALLDYAPWGVRVSNRRARLTAELAALETVPTQKFQLAA